MGTEIIKDSIWMELSSVLDPELNLPVTDLGIIYDIAIDKETVVITFTLTYPGCPLADLLDREIRKAAHRVEGVKFVDTKLVWEPVWGPEMMSETARFSLGYDI